MGWGGTLELCPVAVQCDLTKSGAWPSLSLEPRAVSNRQINKEEVEKATVS